MCLTYDMFRIEPVLGCPGSPHALHGRSGSINTPSISKSIALAEKIIFQNNS
jgi:hypothetical protein